MEALTHWVCFLFLLRKLPILRKLLSPGMLETDQCHPNSERPTALLSCQLPTISITSVSPKMFERLVSVRLIRFVERSDVLPATQFAYRKGLSTCDALLGVSHIMQSALESGQKLGLCRLISAQPLIGPTIRAFSISSDLLVLEVLCCLYWHSFYQTYHSTLWWMVVGVNWLKLY